MDTYLTVDVLASWLATIIKTFFWNEISIIMPFAGWGGAIFLWPKKLPSPWKPQNGACMTVWKDCPLVSTRGHPRPAGRHALHRGGL